MSFRKNLSLMSERRRRSGKACQGERWERLSLVFTSVPISLEETGDDVVLEEKSLG